MQRQERDTTKPGGKADVVKSLSAKIPYLSPDHPLPCLLMPKFRQATGAEHLEMSHHRIGKVLNHICLPRRRVTINKDLRRFTPPFDVTNPIESGQTGSEEDR
jgi:hypothetical protein